jgi:hypothetical protein
MSELSNSTYKIRRQWFICAVKVVVACGAYKFISRLLQILKRDRKLETPHGAYQPLAQVIEDQVSAIRAGIAPLYKNQ